MARLFGTKQAAKYSLEHGAADRQGACRLAGTGTRQKAPAGRFVFTFKPQDVQADEQYDGYTALVTTVPLDQASGDQLFRKYKEQIYCEHVNRQFKGPLAVHPLFLHTPERIEALVFLLMITLMLYFLLQRLYRQSVPAEASSKNIVSPRSKSCRRSRAIPCWFITLVSVVKYTPLGRG